MAVVLKKPIKKRKRGERAGLSRAKITDSARKHLHLYGHVGFTIRALAKKLGVASATINSHFKGGMEELVETIARSELDQLTPPHKPQQTPEDYLRAVFRAAASSFRTKGYIGRVVVYHLTDSPFLSPLFSERICAELEAFTTQEIANAFDFFIDRLVALIMVETGQMALKEPGTAGALLKEKLAGLEKNEHPTLHKFAEKLCANYLKRVASNYLEEASDKAAAALFADLKVVNP